jgi:prolyl-tRNA synthetase
MMHDKKALQSGTSHFFGDGFAKQFGITFTDKDNQQKAPFETSWGMSTRIIGGIIMTHGDNNGLVLPPRIAPVQVVVVPVAQHKPGVTEKAQELFEAIKATDIRAKIDLSDNSLGWKCAQYEMKGVPVRVELGPKDIENGVCVAVRRDNGEKIQVKLDEIAQRLPQILDDVQNGLYQKAKKNLDEHIYTAHSLEEAKELQEKNGGFIKTMWCGDLQCELDMKEKAGMSSRCIPFEQEKLGDVCACCGKPAKTMIYWGVAY